MSARARLFVTGVMAVLLTGCTAADGPSTEPTLPPRPASVAADRTAPCAMLAPDQATRLGLRRPTPIQVVVDGRPSPGCTWIGTEIGYNIQVIPIGADAAIAVPGSTITQVNGFGAVQNLPDLPGSPPVCQVAVDAAPGQTIRVQANAVPKAPYGMDELCRRAEETASMVMTTVVAAAPR